MAVSAQAKTTNIPYEPKDFSLKNAPLKETKTSQIPTLDIQSEKQTPSSIRSSEGKVFVPINEENGFWTGGSVGFDEEKLVTPNRYQMGVYRDSMSTLDLPIGYGLEYQHRDLDLRNNPLQDADDSIKLRLFINAF